MFTTLPLLSGGCPLKCRFVADTFIGNDQLRGVSGGQRKRVTTGGAFLTASLPSLPIVRLHCVKQVPCRWQQRCFACAVACLLIYVLQGCCAKAASLQSSCMPYARSSNSSGMCAGEMIVGPKKTLFLDEISTGLDSSTTFQITRTLREFSHIRKATVLVALLQPTPETYNLFDDVMLLSEGMCWLCKH